MQRSTRNDRPLALATALAIVVAPFGVAMADSHDVGVVASEATDTPSESEALIGPDTGEVAPGSEVAPWDEPAPPAAAAPESGGVEAELARYESGAADLDFPAKLDPTQTSSDLPGTPGMDAQGNRGHIHAVRGGDTLWDISNLYLDTPWTWPAIWKDNRTGIANPHRIFPGDRIWISPTEMRPITPAEADEFIAAAAAAPLIDPDEAASWTATPESSLAVSGLAPEQQQRTIRVAGVNTVSFVTADELEAATSIVESPTPRVFLSQGDAIYIGLGLGETEVGARYTIFREAEEVRDFETNALYGYHVDVLGWVEVKTVGPETSVAEIRVSKDSIERGDRMIPRMAIPLELAASPAPTDIDGRVIYMPNDRTQAASQDFLYLDRGSIHGLEVGHMLEVYDAGGLARDRVRGSRVTTPDWNIATLVVTAVQPDSAVAFVTHARRELAVGDTVRSVSSGTTSASLPASRR